MKPTRKPMPLPAMSLETWRYNALFWGCLERIYIYMYIYDDLQIPPTCSVRDTCESKTTSRFRSAPAKSASESPDLKDLSHSNFLSCYGVPSVNGLGGSSLTAILKPLNNSCTDEWQDKLSSEMQTSVSSVSKLYRSESQWTKTDLNRVLRGLVYNINKRGPSMESCWTIVNMVCQQSTIRTV